MVKKKRQVFKWIDCFGHMRESMTHVVTEACVGHKYQDCVAVCPVEAFRETDTYLVIDPDECIDCGACEPECPVEAIFEESELPEEWNKYTEINAKWFTQ